jgi:hypothetical protein
MLLASGASFAPAARADEWNKETTLTFNEPVEVPGKVLPAGTYVFKLADSQSDRDIVQIFTKGEKQLLTTVMAIPDSRAEPTDKTVVTFEERASGSPEALHDWFYPGETTGVEFLYPKSGTPVALNSQGPAPVAAALAPAQRTVAVQPAIEQLDEAPPASVVVREPGVIMAQALPPAADNASPVQNESAPASMPDTLPQTSGNFASIPLLGVMLLSGGFAAIRFATRQG